MTMKRLGLYFFVMSMLSSPPLFAIDNLKLNSKLDYTSDSQDGPLITGDRLEDATIPGKPAYAIFYGEGCFNSKRQARRTVALSERYKDKVNFIIIDLDKPQSPAHLQLVQRYYEGSIPDLILLNDDGKPVYNQAGEQSEEVLSHILDAALQERH